MINNSDPKSIESYFQPTELDNIKKYVLGNQPTRLSLDLEQIQKNLQNQNNDS